MRVLLITDNHAPTGGAEHYFFDLKTRLKQTPGMEVYSLGFGPSQTHGEDYSVFKSTSSKMTKLIWQMVFHPLMYFKIRLQIKKFQPDVIHLHNIKQYTASLLLAIKPYPVVHTVHDYGMICPTAHNIHKDHRPCPSGLRLKCFFKHQVKYNLLVYLGLTLAFLSTKKRLQRVTKHFFAPSPLLVEYLQFNGFNRVTYIAPFKKDTDSYSFQAMDPYHFLFAGNLGPHKGAHLLLEEFALAWQKEPQLRLTIAGTGPEEARMRITVKKLGIADQVLFTGWQENLDPYYKTCAAVIFPSLWLEAFGLIISEAMGHARPVIGSNRGSPPWLIDDQKTGLIFDPLKRGDLAEKLLMVAGNKTRLMDLGRLAYQKLEGLIDNKKILDQIIARYKEVAKVAS